MGLHDTPAASTDTQQSVSSAVSRDLVMKTVPADWAVSTLETREGFNERKVLQHSERTAEVQLACATRKAHSQSASGDPERPRVHSGYTFPHTTPLASLSYWPLNEVYASIDRSEAGTKGVPGQYPLKVSLNLKASAAWGRAGTWKSS